MCQPQAMASMLDESERTRCEVWTRVMGYHRPVSSFNVGKKSEHKERQHFREGCAASCMSQYEVWRESSAYAAEELVPH